MRELINLPSFNRLTLPILLMAAAVVVSKASSAADAATRWACRYGGDTTLICTLKGAPRATALDAREAATFASGRGTALADARAGRLPALVQTIRGRPGALLGKQVKIPLHTELTDIAFARQLAQAVMCGSRAGCLVEFEPTRSELAQLSSADLVDRTDAALDE